MNSRPMMQTQLSDDQFDRARDPVEEWVDTAAASGTLFDLWCRHVGIEPNTYECAIAYAAFSAARDYFERKPRTVES